MRKLIFSSFAMALLLLGCAKVEVSDTNKNAPGVIAFGSSYVGKATKATDATTATMQAATPGFYVYSYGTDGNIEAAISVGSAVMTNLAVSYNAPDWTYSGTPHYWPNVTNYKLHFFAYANATVSDWTNLLYSAGIVYPTFKYTCPQTYNAQTDLLFTSAYNKNEYVTKQKVQMEFKHALTKINFAGRTAASGYYTEITSISLLNVNQVGKFTYSEDVQEGDWSDVGTPYGSDVVYPIKTDVKVVYDAGIFFTNFRETNASLMLIPKNAATVKIKVEFVMYNASEQPISGTIVKYADIDASTAWTVGKNICYNLIFDPADLTGEYKKDENGYLLDAGGIQIEDEDGNPVTDPNDPKLVSPEKEKLVFIGTTPIEFEATVSAWDAETGVGGLW